MRPVASYISGFASFALLCWSVSQIGVYNSYYVSRSIQFKQAKTFIQSETCTNPHLKSQLGEFNLCDKSSKILYTQPWLGAVFDTAEDLRVCGHGSCSKNLPKIIISVLIFAVVVLLASGVQIRKSNARMAMNHFTLPIGGPTIRQHID
jgi:hypothetical protein